MGMVDNETGTNHHYSVAEKSAVSLHSQISNRLGNMNESPQMVELNGIAKESEENSPPDRHDKEECQAQDLCGETVGGNSAPYLDNLREQVASDTLGDQTFFDSPFLLPIVDGERNTDEERSHKKKSYQVPLIYCDHTASNRCLYSIEHYLQDNVLPCLANTHTTTSFTGTQSTSYMGEARQLVAECVNAKITGKAATDLVLFCGAGGAGVTSAVNVLVDILGIRDLVQQCIRNNSPHLRPILFTSAMEHHSNLLPWREAGCHIVTIPLDCQTGDLDITYLKQVLRDPKYGYIDPSASSFSSNTTTKQHSQQRLRMASFSACSNITGRVSCNITYITALLHMYGVLSFWDYATAASYLPMDMNPTSIDYGNSSNNKTNHSTTIENEFEHSPTLLLAKDAMFVSPHKLLGGPGSVGVLVIKKSLVSRTASISDKSGGGTVFYVTRYEHRFLTNRTERYEGGSPNVPGIVKTGLAFLYKRRLEHTLQTSITTAMTKEGHHNHNPSDDAPSKTICSRTETHDNIRLWKERLNTRHYQRITSFLQKEAPNLILLGTPSPKQGTTTAVSIFSFLILCGENGSGDGNGSSISSGYRFLHFNYVCALLNDMFGIQSRGGCQCAGPYVQQLLGLTDQHGEPNSTNHRLERALVEHKHYEVIRPGVTRLSLPLLYMRECEIQYVLGALVWVSKHGWKLMPLYRINHKTGEWRHHSRQGAPLGKQSRKWLHHYQPPFQQQKEHLSTTREGSNASRSYQQHDNLSEKKRNAVNDKQWSQHLDQALANADLILSDAMAHLKLLQTSADGSTDDILPDSIADLRWYIYPHECRRWLQLGLDPVKEITVESMEDCCRQKSKISILGAVQPIDLCGYGPDVLPLLESTATSMNTDNVDMKENDDEEEDQGDRWEVELLKEAGRTHEHKDEATITRQQKSESMVTKPQAAVLPAETSTFIEVQSLEQAQAAPRLKSFCSLNNGACNINSKPNSDISDNKKVESTEETRSTINGVNGNNAQVGQKEMKGGGINDTVMGGGDTAASSLAVKHLERIASAATAFGLTEKKNDKKGTDGSTEMRDAVKNQQDLSQQLETITQQEQQGANATAGNNKKKRKAQQHKHVKPPAKLQRLITRALIQWNMIQDGDKLLLGLSGGKDSLTLLHCLLEFQRILPTKFTLEVCTIDPMTESFDPSPLIPYVRNQLGLTYHYLQQPIVDRANTSGDQGQMVSSLCSYCARMKRGLLYQCARQNKCNKLVLAQHLDDCAESFMMSFVHNGFLRTMKANYRIDAEDLTVIRPLIYVRESQMTQFATDAGLPIINENCPACFEEPKERARIKKLLLREETQFPALYDNLRKALVPLMHEDMQFLLRYYTEQVVSKSRKPQGDGSFKKKKEQETSPTKGNKRQKTLEPSTQSKGKEQNSVKMEDTNEEIEVEGGVKVQTPIEASKTITSTTTNASNPNENVPTDAEEVSGSAGSVAPSLTTPTLQEATIEQLMAELSRRHLGNVKVPTMINGQHGQGFK